MVKFFSIDLNNFTMGEISKTDYNKLSFAELNKKYNYLIIRMDLKIVELISLIRALHEFAPPVS